MAELVLVVAGLILAGVGVGEVAAHFIRIRLPRTMRSDDAWLAGHKASCPFTVLPGVLMAMLGLDMLIDPDQPPPEWLLLAAVLTPLLIGAVRAHIAALR